MRLKLVLTYDGTAYRGWAAQPGLRTIESVVRGSLDTIFPSWNGLVVAGRTDAGVHALGNVAGVEVEGGPAPARVAEALNSALPEDVAILSAEEAAPDFHARFSARARSYRYRIWRSRLRSPFESRRSWWYPQTLDLERLQTHASRLPGQHDFRAFTPTETRHKEFVREVHDAGWHQDGDVVTFEITADSFLRHMVRSLVGTMVDDVDIGPLLDGRRHRRDAGQTAPAHGLYLVSVRY